MKINIELLITLSILIIPLFIIVEFRQRLFIMWKIKYEIRYKEKVNSQKQALEEKEREKNSKVRIGNSVIESIIKHYNIIFWGGLGSGKSLMANVVTKYIVDKAEVDTMKQLRMLRYMNPGYLEELQRLIDNQKLNVYSDISLVDTATGFTSHDFWPYLTQKKKVVENGVFFSDELGRKLGKDQYNKQQSEKDPDYIKAEDTTRFARQNTNSHFIGTEQSEDNVWKPIRDKGFASVHMLSTYVWLSKMGQFRKRFKIFLFNILPFIFTVNLEKLLLFKFTKKQKFKTILFSLLPGGAWFLKKQYYIKKINIVKKIKDKYTNFKCYFEFEGKVSYLTFKNKDKYDYNTRGNKDRYQNQFDSNGNNKYLKVEANNG